MRKQFISLSRIKLSLLALGLLGVENATANSALPHCVDVTQCDDKCKCPIYEFIGAQFCFSRGEAEFPMKGKNCATENTIVCPPDINTYKMMCNS